MSNIKQISNEGLVSEYARAVKLSQATGQDKYTQLSMDIHKEILRRLNEKDR